MKKVAIITGMLAIAVFTQAQKIKESEVPAAVKSAFSKSFPKGKDVKWSRESAGEIEAEFEAEGNEMSANFTTAGVWTGTETEIRKSELPKGVLDAIAKNFAGYQIEEAEKAEAPGKAVAYETELKKGKVTWEVRFAADGTVVKKEEKTDKKEKDERK